MDKMHYFPGQNSASHIQELMDYCYNEENWLYMMEL